MDIEILDWTSDLDRPSAIDALDTADLPVCHTVSVTERRISIDDRTLIQNNVRTDTLALNLDGEWDGANVVVLIGKTGSEVELAWAGEPIVIPAQVADSVGAIDVSVVGYSSDGTVRLVTAEAAGAMTVIRSGALTGEVPAEDVPDVLSQLLESATQARQAASTATSAAQKATASAASADAATEAAQSATTAATQATQAAQTATTAANGAASSATAAAGSATSAAQAAQSAATSASEAATSATSASEAATASAGRADAAAVRVEDAVSAAEAATKAAQDATAEATTATSLAKESATAAAEAANTANAVIAQLPLPDGNVPRTTRRGEVVSVDDAFAATPLGLRVYGKTRQNLWVNPSGTSNGVTVTSNENGSMTATGTASSETSIAVQSYILKPSTTYSLSADNAPTDFPIGIYEYDGSGGWLATHSLYGERNTVTFTTNPNISRANFNVYAESGTTVSGTYRVMLNEGSTAEPWCPPGLTSAEPTQVVVAGKNLGTFINLTASGGVLSNNGITCKLLEDGGVRVFGTAAGGNALIAFGENKITTNWQVTLSGIPSPTSGLTLRWSDIVKGFQFTTGTPKTFMSSDTGRGQFVVVVNSNTTIDTVIYPQLELGSTATAYEPPNVTTLTLDPVELRGLPDGTADVLDVGSGSVESPVYQLEPESVSYADVINGGVRGAVKNATAANLPSNTKSMSSHFYWNHEWSKLGGFTCENSQGTLYFQLPSSAVTSLDKSGVDSWLATNKPSFVLYRPTPTTYTVTPVALPTLPSPVCNVWAVSDVPCEVEMEYVRDVNVVLSKLEGAL